MHPWERSSQRRGTNENVKPAQHMSARRRQCRGVSKARETTARRRDGTGFISKEAAFEKGPEGCRGGCQPGRRLNYSTQN